MDTIQVKDLMVPVTEMPSVNENGSFTEAVEGLAQVLEEFKSGKRKSRTLLVINDAGAVVGKITPADILRSLDSNYQKLLDNGISAHVSKFSYLINSLSDGMQQTTQPWSGMCSRIASLKVKDFIKIPPATQVIAADETMDEAIHRFVLAKHDALFVTDGKYFVGLLALSPVYDRLVQKVKEDCK